MSSAINLLLPDERHRVLTERLAADGRIVAADLARELGISEDTIRRDLRELAGLGLCRRVYGGALPVAASAEPLVERRHTDVDRKSALAAKAVALVRTRNVLFIDSGSTNEAIAKALPQDFDLTVATNAPAVAMALLGRPGFEIILIGGRLDPHTGAVLGARAIRDVRGMRPDLCFLGACAVDDRAGVTAFSFEDAEFKSLVAASSRRVAIAAATKKLGKAAPFTVLTINQLHHLVMEDDAPKDRRAAYEDAGVRVH
jgi:DeoR/GlpR family transcriptional regulator of sugar metabolism